MSWFQQHMHAPQHIGHEAASLLSPVFELAGRGCPRGYLTSQDINVHIATYPPPWPVEDMSY